MIIWLGHAAFRIIGNKQIYIDPYQIKKGSPAADIILVTHEHAGHCSPADIEKIVVPGTIIITNSEAGTRLERFKVNLILADAEQTFTFGGISIETAPAYTTKTEGKNSKEHDTSHRGLGFIVTISGQRIYHAGDTGFIPEMSKTVCDIALLPVSGGTVMDADEAALAAETIHTSLAIPMHYGSLCGSIMDAQKFCRCVTQRGIAAKLLTPP
jgi:L-ascorbate metabolism protein UlaG (beta-lactamase superfamily)